MLTAWLISVFETLVISLLSLDEVPNLGPPTEKEQQARAAHLAEFKTMCGWDEMPLTPEQDAQFEDWIQQYLPAFPTSKNHLGVIRGFVYDLDFANPRPFQARAYRVSPAEREVVRENIERLIGMGVIQPSMSPWASPLLMVPKPDGSMRMCVDYRQLNKQTVKVPFPIPDIDSYLHALKGRRYFCTLDMTAAYWQ
eukprot:32490-Eustigmatos_ZCMA.PRE.1